VASYQRGERVIITGNGFTYWGLVFAWGWLFSRALWLKGLIVLVLYLPIYFFQSIMMSALFDGTKIENHYILIPTILLVIIHLTIGFKGNQWLHESLLRKGYKMLS